MDCKTKFLSRLQESIAVKQDILNNNILLDSIVTASRIIIDCYQQKGKVFFCGNGGSAADAQHLAAELSGRFYFDRPPLYAEALHVNTSYLTAVANDYGYQEVFARMITACGAENDVLVVLSTSGNSTNILKAINSAKDKKMHIIGLTGKTGGKMASVCDCLLNVPSENTPRIQEAHITIGHLICEEVENVLFGKE
ncbi:MAG: D-sedoheptulose 7-phosphate isomerase [Bacteroidales bacterium]|nr:D-sedoheptulose 7-phosphate isomerase [Bacteroidales bacterium]